MTEQLMLSFDYGSLDAETRIVVKQKTDEIKSLMRRSAQDIIDIGQKLIDVKARLGHGNYGQWLKAEFDWSDETARRFVNVAERFGQKPQIVEFAPSALYLLAASTTPDEAREEALERAANGEAITYTTAKGIVEANTPAPEEVPLKFEAAVDPDDPQPRPAESGDWRDKLDPEKYYPYNTQRQIVVNEAFATGNALYRKYPWGHTKKTWQTETGARLRALNFCSAYRLVEPGEPGEQPKSLNDLVKYQGGVLDQGAYDRAIDIAHKLKKAHYWGGILEIWIDHPYQMHTALFGPRQIHFDKLIIKINEKQGSMTVSLPSELYDPPLAAVPAESDEAEQLPPDVLARQNALAAAQETHDAAELSRTASPTRTLDGPLTGFQDGKLYPVERKTHTVFNDPLDTDQAHGDYHGHQVAFIFGRHINNHRRFNFWLIADPCRDHFTAPALAPLTDSKQPADPQLAPEPAADSSTPAWAGSNTGKDTPRSDWEAALARGGNGNGHKATALDALHSSKSVEWYTPAQYLDAARTVLGSIDLDPASCEVANARVGGVKAARYYTEAQDGLTQDWTAKTVWLNPPYGRNGNFESNQAVWSARLIANFEAGKIGAALLLVSASTAQDWFQPLWDYPICFVTPRINFDSPDGSTSGSNHGSVIVLFSHDHDQLNTFVKAYSPCGRIVVPLNQGLGVHLETGIRVGGVL